MYEIATTPINCVIAVAFAVVGFIFCKAMYVAVSTDEIDDSKKHTQA